jgi:hypothetical protein
MVKVEKNSVSDGDSFGDRAFGDAVISLDSSDGARVSNEKPVSREVIASKIIEASKKEVSGSLESARVEAERKILLKEMANELRLGLIELSKSPEVKALQVYLRATGEKMFKISAHWDGGHTAGYISTCEGGWDRRFGMTQSRHSLALCPHGIRIAVDKLSGISCDVDRYKEIDWSKGLEDTKYSRWMPKGVKRQGLLSFGKISFNDAYDAVESGVTLESVREKLMEVAKEIAGKVG